MSSVTAEPGSAELGDEARVRPFLVAGGLGFALIALAGTLELALAIAGPSPERLVAYFTTYFGDNWDPLRSAYGFVHWLPARDWYAGHPPDAHPLPHNLLLFVPLALLPTAWARLLGTLACALRVGLGLRLWVGPSRAARRAVWPALLSLPLAELLVSGWGQRRRLLIAAAGGGAVLAPLLAASFLWDPNWVTDYLGNLSHYHMGGAALIATRLAGPAGFVLLQLGVMAIAAWLARGSAGRPLDLDRTAFVLALCIFSTPFQSVYSGVLVLPALVRLGARRLEGGKPAQVTRQLVGGLVHQLCVALPRVLENRHH